MTFYLTFAFSSGGAFALELLTQKPSYNKLQIFQGISLIKYYLVYQNILLVRLKNNNKGKVSYVGRMPSNNYLIAKLGKSLPQ